VYVIYYYRCKEKGVFLDPDLDQKIARRESWEYLLDVREPEQRNNASYGGLEARAFPLLKRIQCVA
jgi:hypothetical protein